MSKRAGNSYPYLLVGEGLKKNHSSDRLRTYVSSKVAKRAQIEMGYIRELQEWVEDLRPLTDCTSNGYLDTEMTRRILGCMKQDALTVVEARQRVYNALMLETGPYNKLQRPEDGHVLVKLMDIDEEYASMSHTRQDVEQSYRRHQERREHASHQIEALEGQLSQRSRLVTSRRPSTRSGPRKVDEMQEKLSKLRQQHENEAERAETLGKQLSEIESGAEHALTTMDERLQQLEMDRIKYIIDQVKVYIDSVQNMATQGVSGRNRPSQYSLDTIEGLLNVHWVDVRANARRVERGEIVKYTDMFEVKPLRADFKKSGAISKGLVRDRRDTGRRMFNVTSEANERLLELLPTESILTHLNAHKSGSESSVEDVSDEDQNGSNSSLDATTPRDAGARNAGRSDAGQNGSGNWRRNNTSLQHVPKSTKSNDSIESLELPPEVYCTAEITRIDPNRQYTTRMKLARTQADSRPTTAQITEYCSMTRFNADETDSDEDISSGNDVSGLCNVRVVAKQDSYPAPGTNQLLFKTGQTIKQKQGVDAYGLCYGWTRESRMGKKIYGYYKPNLVRLMNHSK